MLQTTSRTTSANFNVFEERAENLSQQELTEWTFLSEAEQQIVKKLTGPGAKLISGPRGSGKSTLLRIALFQLNQSKSAFPIYVNFSRALALEPLFHTHADALRWFRQWILAKLTVGVQESCSVWNITLDASSLKKIENAKEFISTLETGRAPIDVLEQTPTSISQFLNQVSSLAGVNRTVLLLDDAAHAFSVKQQREFFEIFRELRSREISAKAAIYPGVTSFSPSFQVGHEAELIEIWIRHDAPTFLNTMQQIALRRFPNLEENIKTDTLDLINTLGLASFGLPRGFVNMISEVVDSVELGTPLRRAILDAIASNSESVLKQFSNVADKLPRFSNYIQVGQNFESATLAALRLFNKLKSENAKSATVGISEPLDPELGRVLRFMEYAGLVRRIDDLSQGEKGNYQRYVFHYSRVISSNTLFLGKSYKLSDVVDSLKKPLASALIRTKPGTLLGPNYAASCVLALPPCPDCNTARLGEDQKFCMHCGFELRSASLYLELLKSSVSKLSLPQRKIDALKEAGVSTIGQLLTDENYEFKKSGSSIGPIWARRIINLAEEFVSV